MNGKWLAAFALASLCGVAHADPNTRLPCTTDNTDNCYTPYVHPDSAQGGGTAGGAVYGTDATGVAPTKPPLFIAGVDGNGKIVPFTITANGLQFFATSLPLPTGASTDASVQAVKTALGSPFQANGSVGNTGFNALQNGAANSATNQFFEQTVGPSMQAPGTAPTIVRGVQGATGGIPVNTNAQQINGTALATGTGASNIGTPRVAVSSDSTFAISNTSFAVTQSGTWNVGLLAGSAIVGKVGIDQTTPGTTNKVSIGTDGTVSATQSGAYTVTQGPAGAAAWKVDGSGVTQPVSATALPLPVGAATAANQPSNAAQGSTTSGQTGTLTQCAVLTSAPSYTTAQTQPCTLTLAGAIRVDGSGVTQPVSMASAPLPAGAATSANQTNVQSAPGTSAGTALTIQGASNGVAIPTTPTNAATVATAANQNSTAAGTSATNAQGVQGVTGGVALPVSGTVTANLGTIAGAATAANQPRFAQFSETPATGTPIAASNTLTGTIRAVGSPANFTRFNAFIFATGSGTAGSLTIKECFEATCVNGAFVVSTTSITGSTPTTVTAPPLTLPYVQVSFVNGAAAITVFVADSLTSN